MRSTTIVTRIAILACLGAVAAWSFTDGAPVVGILLMVVLVTLGLLDLLDLLDMRSTIITRIGTLACFGAVAAWFFTDGAPVVGLPLVVVLVTVGLLYLLDPQTMLRSRR
jgi:hypothetical protein